MKYFVFILIALVFSSCETNWGKYGGYKMEYDSAMDYYIVLDKGKAIYGTNPEDLKKGTLVKYYRPTGKIDSIWLGKGGIIIEPFVDDDKVSFDKTFILVTQKPLSEICECNLECFKKMDSYDKRSYPRCKEALEKSDFYQYWIINKIQNVVYGPLSKEKFFQKREELGVPRELQLKE